MPSLDLSAVSAASTAALGSVQGAAATLVLRKALDAQQSSAAQLLEALPPPAPSPAISGSLGTQVDTWA